MSVDQDGPSGPFEAFEARPTLAARVVEGDTTPRIHGYDVHDDLARHYTFGELVLLTLTGRPPAEAEGRAFETALVFLAPANVGEAPGHAAVLARLFGADSRGLLAAAALALGEQVHAAVAAGSVPRNGHDAARFPDTACPDYAALRCLSDHVRRAGLDASELFAEVATIDEAALRVLAACGLTERWQREAAVVLARLPAVLAEAWAVRPGDFADYPTRLPDFAYETDDD